MKTTLFLILFLTSTISFSLEPFAVTSYSVATLYKEAKELIQEKKYDKAIEKLKICQQTKRCSSKLIELYSTVGELKNIQLVEKYTEIAFSMGEDKVYHNLAVLYYKENNITKAKEFFQKSGEAKIYESLFNLGQIFEKENNIAQAIKNYKIASEHNISEGDYSLGVLYYKHKNINKSLFYFNKAKKQGYKPADKALKSITNAIAH
ncbi:hypothetical protein JHD49_03815 [Sulfurimonas sp. SAG-AH-194-C21]|nr:hypothetical protein [Sulfurimonas sp. SAG-AH-194-C21]MDF1883058.1 hypothetical protein [Sulfurimonas sp. SAG-AH-194-C21]